MNDDGELVTIQTIRHWLLEEWDLSVTPAHLKKRLKKLGFRWGKKHGKDVCIAWTPEQEARVREHIIKMKTALQVRVVQ